MNGRVLRVVAGWLLALAVAAGLADAVVAPAGHGGRSVVYVDAVMGDDANDGRSTDRPKRTIGAGLAVAGPGTEVLITGYGAAAVYKQYETGCVTLRGEPGRPVVVRSNPYVPRRRPLDVTTTVPLPAAFEPEGDGRWTLPWPTDPRMLGDTGTGLVQVGQIALVGFPREPARPPVNSAWWSDGHLHLVLQPGVDPNRYVTKVRQGAGFCLTGDSAHVVIRDAQVIGAVRTVEVMPGAVDIDVGSVYGDRLVAQPSVAAGSEPVTAREQP